MPIKILFIHSNTAVGGATNSLLFNLLSLPKEEFSVKVLFLGNEGPASKLYIDNGIEIDHLSGIVNYQHAENGIIKWISRNPLKPITQFIGMLRSVKYMLAYLKKQDCDLVHINTSVMLPVGIAAKKMNLPVVWHVREPIAKGVLGIRRFFVRQILNKCSTEIIAISKNDAKALGHIKNINIVYNYVDFDKFKKTQNNYLLHDELNIHIEKKIIITLGGIVHSKGADVFLESIKEIIAIFPECHFVIVGYPPNTSKTKRTMLSGFFPKTISEKCEEIISNNKLESYVSFIGLRKDIPNLLNSSHLLIWPATVGHFSRPVIEAQALGIPCVATEFSSSREIIKDNQTGLLFENRNSNDLAQKVIKILSDQKLYDDISANGYGQAYLLFNKDINIELIKNIYKKIIEKRN